MPTTIKDAIKMFEERKQVVAIEQEKASCRWGGAALGGEKLGIVLEDNYTELLFSGAQVELHGICPSIDKMDATLSTLKACK